MSVTARGPATRVSSAPTPASEEIACRARVAGRRMILLGAAGVLIGTALVVAWPPARFSEDDLQTLIETFPLLVGWVCLYCGVRLHRTAGLAHAALAGPPRTLYLTTAIEHGPQRSRSLRATLRRSPDQADADVDLQWGIYQRPNPSAVANTPATVYGTLSPGSALIVATDQATLIGRVRYSALEVERLRELASCAPSPQLRDAHLNAARDIACKTRRPSVEVRVWLWTSASIAVLVPLTALAHRGHGGIGLGVSSAILIGLLWLRRRLAARRRAALGF
jgi:hypothetical protein